MANSHDDRRVLLSLQLAQRVESTNNHSDDPARLQLNEKLSTLADDSTASALSKSTSTSRRSSNSQQQQPLQPTAAAHRFSEKSTSWANRSHFDAKSSSSEWKDYKSGAVFSGVMKDHLKSGQVTIEMTIKQ